jgi:hypothetical protein
MDAGGVDAAILTPHTPWDPNANELCIEAVRAQPDRFAILGNFALDKPESRARVDTWIAMMAANFLPKIAEVVSCLSAHRPGELRQEVIHRADLFPRPLPHRVVEPDVAVQLGLDRQPREQPVPAGGTPQTCPRARSTQQPLGGVDLGRIEDVSTYPALFAELIGRGWSDRDLVGLSRGNILRVMREAETVAGRLARRTRAARRPGRR